MPCPGRGQGVESPAFPPHIHRLGAVTHKSSTYLCTVSGGGPRAVLAGSSGPARRRLRARPARRMPGSGRAWMRSPQAGSPPDAQRRREDRLSAQSAASPPALYISTGCGRASWVRSSCSGCARRSRPPTLPHHPSLPGKDRRPPLAGSLRPQAEPSESTRPSLVFTWSRYLASRQETTTHCRWPPESTFFTGCYGHSFNAPRYEPCIPHHCCQIIRRTACVHVVYIGTGEDIHPPASSHRKILLPAPPQSHELGVLKRSLPVGTGWPTGLQAVCCAAGR